MSYAEENVGFLQWRDRERRGGNINKTISSHYNRCSAFYFYFVLRNLRVTLVGNDLTQHPLPQWHIVAWFCYYSMSLFYDIP